MSLAVPDGQSRVRSPQVAFWRASTPIAFCAGLWILCHPYFGVIHDARLYLIQALHRLDPGRWDQDLYFRFGSQDSFSLFTAAYAPLVAWLGLGGAHLAATIAGEALWFGALCGLAFALLDKPLERYAAIAAVALLSPAYGGLGIFNYAEPFATPRLWSEGLVLAAFAFGARGRLATMVVLMALAAAFHPLMAACGVGVALLLAAFSNPRLWILLGVGALIAAAAVALRLGPIARLLATYDPAWWSVVVMRSPFTLVSDWSVSDWLHKVAGLGGLIAFMTVASARERRIAAAVLVVGVSSLAASWVLADRVHNVLAMGAQLWRAMWLASVAANFALPLILLRYERRDACFWLLALIIVANGAARFLGGLGDVASLLTIVAWLTILVRSRLGPKPSPLTRPLFWAVTALSALVLVQYLVIPLVGDPLLEGHLKILSLALLAAMGIWLSVDSPTGAWLIVLAAPVLVSEAAMADMRPNWSRFVYGSGPTRGLDAFLADAGNTWWEGDDGLVLQWFRARRPSYTSCLQGSEAIFIRGEALEWGRREGVVSQLNPQDARDCAWRNHRPPAISGPLSPVQLANVCHALPDLDTIVLEHPVPQLSGRSWTAPAHVVGAQNHRFARVFTFWRYDCGPLRAESQPLAR